jgi:hypothetical protein
MQNSSVQPAQTHPTTATSPNYQEGSPGLRKVRLTGEMPHMATVEIPVMPPRGWNENR